MPYLIKRGVHEFITLKDDFYNPSAIGLSELTLDTSEVVHLLVFIATALYKQAPHRYNLRLATPLEVEGKEPVHGIDFVFDPINDTVEFFDEKPQPVFFLITELNKFLERTNISVLQNVTESEISTTFNSDEKIVVQEGLTSAFAQHYFVNNKSRITSIRPLTSKKRDKRLLLVSHRTPGYDVAEHVIGVGSFAYTDRQAEASTLIDVQHLVSSVYKVRYDRGTQARNVELADIYRAGSGYS